MIPHNVVVSTVPIAIPAFLSVIPPEYVSPIRGVLLSGTLPRLQESSPLASGGSECVAVLEPSRGCYNK
jgi:hypothetical protein